MKKPVMKFLFIMGIFFSVNANAQNPVNWTDKQLMQPSALADIMTSKKEDITIISIGPFNTIPNAINIGMVSEKDKLDTFKKQLSSLKKDKKIVVYCGCCPYEHCPNVRPAIDVLKEMKFTNYYLLDLPKNLRVNWIDKGYPVVKQ
ncbi:MAG TPA: rhodanese-like domain-containing protein [Parafilimonas sp.]|nr:rhodanese-like domain-containing protein [Parafilimonas sp.]